MLFLNKYMNIFYDKSFTIPDHYNEKLYKFK